MVDKISVDKHFKVCKIFENRCKHFAWIHACFLLGAILRAERNFSLSYSAWELANKDSALYCQIMVQWNSKYKMHGTQNIKTFVENTQQIIKVLTFYRAKIMKYFKLSTQFGHRVMLFKNQKLDAAWPVCNQAIYTGNLSSRSCEGQHFK